MKVYLTLHYLITAREQVQAEKTKAAKAFDHGFITGLNTGITMYKREVSGINIGDPVPACFEFARTNYPDVWNQYHP